MWTWGDLDVRVRNLEIEKIGPIFIQFPQKNETKEKDFLFCFGKYMCYSD